MVKNKADRKALPGLLAAKVTDDLKKARQAALAAAEGAIHEENRAEGSKDIRSTHFVEASVMSYTLGPSLTRSLYL